MSSRSLRGSSSVSGPGGRMSAPWIHAGSGGGTPCEGSAGVSPKGSPARRTVAAVMGAERRPTGAASGRRPSTGGYVRRPLASAWARGAQSSADGSSIRAGQLARPNATNHRRWGPAEPSTTSRRARNFHATTRATAHAGSSRAGINSVTGVRLFRSSRRIQGEALSGNAHQKASAAPKGGRTRLEPTDFQALSSGSSKGH